MNKRNLRGKLRGLVGGKSIFLGVRDFRLLSLGVYEVSLMG